MINELKVMEKLREVIEKELNDYLDDEFQGLVPGQVLIEFPNVDKMPYPVMVYIQPDYAEYEDQTICADKATFRLAVFLLCKRDTRCNLTLKTYGYYNALYALLRHNTSLDQTVDFATVVDTNFYPAVEANPNVQGAEVSVQTVFEKNF